MNSPNENNASADFLQDDQTHLDRMQKAQVERAQALEGIHCGLAEMEAGKGRPADEFFIEMQAKYSIPDVR